MCFITCEDLNTWNRYVFQVSQAELFLIICPTMLTIPINYSMLCFLDHLQPIGFLFLEFSYTMWNKLITRDDII